jgi:plasmid stabilization system protein ParE
MNLPSVTIEWSDFALQSMAEIIHYYEDEAGAAIADYVQGQLFSQVEKYTTFPNSAPDSDVFPGLKKVLIQRLPYVAFIREQRVGYWQVVDVVHSSRRLPKNVN